MWGVLTRTGGSEDATNVPSTIPLIDEECFFGRFSAPPKQPDNKFTHTTQVLIPCLFVSSTHFSMNKIDNRDGTCSYSITDHSRNGTYINGQLVGQNKTVPISNDMEISLLYKNKVRILYKFAAVDNSKDCGISFLSRSTRSIPGYGNGTDSMKSQTEAVTDHLTKQITVLQEENKTLEEKVREQSTTATTATAELEKYTTKNASLEKTIETLQNEKNDLIERLTAAESHSSAIEARSCKLQDQLDETQVNLRDLRNKNISMTEELERKITQLEARNSLMENNNKTMSAEHNRVTKLEQQCKQLELTIQQSNQRIETLSTANQALQGVVSDNDITIIKLRKLNEQLHTKLVTGRQWVEKRQEAVDILHNRLAQAVTTLQALQADTHTFTEAGKDVEEFMTNETELKWAGSEIEGENETYVECSYPHPAVPRSTPAGTAFSAPNGGESPSVASVDEEEETGSLGSLGVGTKRKRELDETDEFAGIGKVLSRAGTAVDPSINHDVVGIQKDQSVVNVEGESEEEDEDMQKTQAQTSFAHLFEDISQRSHAESVSDDDILQEGEEPKDSLHAEKGLIATAAAAAPTLAVVHDLDEVEQCSKDSNTDSVVVERQEKDHSQRSSAEEGQRMEVQSSDKQHSAD